MLEAQIRKGLKVQIEFSTGSKNVIIDCYIVEPEYDRLTLFFPDSKKEFLPYLTEGTEIKAFVYALSGIFIVDSIIFDEYDDGLITIEFNDEHEVIQRRRFVRIPFLTDLFLIGEEENIKAMTLNISGGGIKFTTNKELSDGSEYEAKLRFAPFDKLISMKGHIHKKAFYKENEYVIEFTEIKEDDREKIIQKCLELEREQNKKY